MSVPAPPEPGFEAAPAEVHVSLEPQVDETLDAICGGRVRVLQSRNGYRFNLDAVLLASFAGRGTGWSEPVMDLGAGSGIVALVLARCFGVRMLTALELQPRLASLAARNTRLNACEPHICVVQGDLRNVECTWAPNQFARVVCNPPYRALREGRVSPAPERALARHEVSCTVAEVAKAAAYLLAPSGSLSVVYPASRLATLLAALREVGLEPSRLCLVHPALGRAAKLVLLQAIKGGTAALRVLPPLVLHEWAGGPLTARVRAMVDGEAVPWADMA